jgi:hypothetical protein
LVGMVLPKKDVTPKKQSSKKRGVCGYGDIYRRALTFCYSFTILLRKAC